MSGGFRQGLWRLADPKISLASIAGLSLGNLLAASDGPLQWPWLLVAVAGILAIETAKNAAGEVVDWDSGTDAALTAAERSPFSGGKRVLVEGLLTRAETWWIAGVAYALGAAAGLAIVLGREPGVLALGAAGIALAWSYHGWPLRLSYRGLGEIAVAIAYGPLVTGGAYLVQRGSLPARVWLASVPLGLLVASFLWVNEFPDYRADRQAGKNTLVVRLGRARAARVHFALVLLAFLVAALLPGAGLPRSCWLGLVAAIPALDASRRLLAAPEHVPSIVPAQVRSLLALVAYAGLCGLGAWLRA